jgi:hypothetical protein
MRAHFKHLCFTTFPMVYGNFQSNELWPLKLFFKNSRVHWDSNSQNGSSLGSVWVHSFTFSYTPENMKCDSQASFSARTFASLCFGCKPKIKVATFWGTFGSNIIVHIVWLFQKHGTFNFGYQCWFWGLTIVIFINIILFNIIFKIIINFIIYIEGSMNIFILYIGILRLH